MVRTKERSVAVVAVKPLSVGEFVCGLYVKWLRDKPGGSLEEDFGRKRRGKGSSSGSSFRGSTG